MRRVFLDPGSRSCGWALFEDGKFLKAGTISSKIKTPIFKRLEEIYGKAKKVAKQEKPEEIYIEILNYRTNYVCIWSVAILGLAFSQEGAEVAQEIPIKSWQGHCEWHEKTKYLWDQVSSPQVFDSEDAWAAYWMGIWWNKKEGI